MFEHERSTTEQLGDLLRALPFGQEYEVTSHDPPLEDGREYTLQLIGPPGMIDGKFIGWEELAKYK